MRDFIFSIQHVLLLFTCLTTILTGCNPSPAEPFYSLPQLEYRLFSKYPSFFWCDPDYYPIAREGQEQKNAVDQFPVIKSNLTEFSAILEYLNLPNKSDYTDAEKLLIYKEHKKLSFAVQMAASESAYKFTLRVGRGQGQRIEGIIDTSGKITVRVQEASINTCPICLAKGTLIDTPGGRVPVEQLTRGRAIWTVDKSGNKVIGEITETSKTPVPLSFRVIQLDLSDGRKLAASPGHPTAEGKTISDYQA